MTFFIVQISDSSQQQRPIPAAWASESRRRRAHPIGGAVPGGDEGAWLTQAIIACRNVELLAISSWLAILQGRLLLYFVRGWESASTHSEVCQQYAVLSGAWLRVHFGQADLNWRCNVAIDGHMSRSANGPGEWRGGAAPSQTSIASFRTDMVESRQNWITMPTNHCSHPEDRQERRWTALCSVILAN
jgi:hypothetical protein